MMAKRKSDDGNPARRFEPVGREIAFRTDGRRHPGDAQGDRQGAAFLELSDENKDALFRGMLRVRRQSTRCTAISSASGTEDPDPMRAALEKFVGLAKENSAISVQLQGGGPSASEIEQGWPAQLHMISSSTRRRTWLREAGRSRASQSPETRDNTRQRRTKAETDGIVAIFKEVGVMSTEKQRRKARRPGWRARSSGTPAAKRYRARAFLKAALSHRGRGIVGQFSGKDSP